MTTIAGIFSSTRALNPKQRSRLWIGKMSQGKEGAGGGGIMLVDVLYEIKMPSVEAPSIL
jgi:hypothetical protein